MKIFSHFKIFLLVLVLPTLVVGCIGYSKGQKHALMKAKNFAYSAMDGGDIKSATWVVQSAGRSLEWLRILKHSINDSDLDAAIREMEEARLVGISGDAKAAASHAETALNHMREM